VLRNIDSGHAKRYLLRHGLAQRTLPPEYLFDLAFDPQEEDNLADDPRYAQIKRDLAARLQEWMERTDDPLLEGRVPPPRRRGRRRRWTRTHPAGSGQVIEAEEAINGVL